MHLLLSTQKQYCADMAMSKALMDVGILFHGRIISMYNSSINVFVKIFTTLYNFDNT